MLNNRYSNTARNIATILENNTSVVVDVTTTEADNYIFRVMNYLYRYFGKYWIEYMGDGTAIIRKQG